MKTKIIALAVAAAFSAPAFAETSNVNVYGQANISFDRTNNGTVSTNQISDNASRIGFKGTEDLGDGLSAIFQVETMVTLDNGGAGTPVGTRDSFVGLSSANMGTVLAGRHYTPYEMATESADLFRYSIADNRNIMGATSNGAGTIANHNLRSGNLLAYMTPDFGGIKGAIAYIPQAEGVTAANAGKPSAWSMAGMYEAGGINASIAFQEFKDSGTTLNLAGNNNKQKAWKIGGGYTMDAINVNAVYEKITSSGPATAVPLIGNSDDHSAWYLSGKYSFGNDAVKLAYAKTGDFGNGTGGTTPNTSVKQWSLGYDHNMSKRTTLFALYTKLNADAGAAGAPLGGQTSAGAIASTGPVGAATDASAWSFGVKHAF